MGSVPSVWLSEDNHSKPFRATGPAVKRLRAELGLSWSAFARRLGVSASTIANWEVKLAA